MSAVGSRRYAHSLPIGLLLLVAGAGAGAQTLDVSRHVIASGGGHSGGGSFSLSGTIGQVDASSTISGGGFELKGGYWSAASPSATSEIFRDGFENPSVSASLDLRVGSPDDNGHLLASGGDSMALGARAGS